MSNTKNVADQRKHERLKAMEGTFVVVTSDYDKIGQIKNISRCGLAFQYIDNGEPLRGLIEIEIFSAAKNFYLRRLPAKVVRDSEIGSSVPFSSLRLRNLVVQFEKMKPNQVLMLDYFLQQYTTK